MKKLLLIGIDTRSMLNSALKLDYTIYSASYFSTSDTPKIKNQKVILKEEYNQSCGVFEDNFNSKTILELSKEYIDEVDYIIPLSGVSPSEFSKKHQKKILGTTNIKDIEDKYKFYKKINKKYLTPRTYKLNDIYEAYEIKNSNKEKKFILKPTQGNGGYDINLLNNNTKIQFNKGEFILQEYIPGISLSSSLLSYKKKAKNIINTRLLTMNDFKKNNNFIYIGNILPLTNKSIMNKTSDVNKINQEMNETSENLASEFNLIGSSGVDYIFNKNRLYIIEINPRIQGTFECVEKSLGINMLDAHIKSCFGEIIKIPKAKKYSYKKIIYSPTKIKYKKIDLDNIYDIPHHGSITEKSQPLLTIIDSDNSFQKLYKRVEYTTEKINKLLKDTN